MFIVVRPNGNRIDTLDTFMEFTTGDGGPGIGITVKGIAPALGTRLEQLLTGDFDNTTGTVEFSAATLETAPISEFDLAVLAITADRLSANDRIDFETLFPRKTLAAFKSVPIPDSRLRLVGVAMEVPEPGTLPNLLKLPGLRTDTTPTFQWDPPISPNPPMRSGLGVGTRGEGRGTRRSALDSDKWGRWRPLVGVGGADGGPGQRRWGGVGGTACKGRQSRTGPVRLCGVVE